MSANPTANIDLRLRTSEFNRGKNDAKRGFDEIGQKGQQNMQKVKNSTDQTTQSMRNLNTQTKQTGIDMKLTGLTIAATAQQSFGLIQGLTGIQTKMLDIKKINLDVAKSQEAVNKMQEAGLQGTKEYAFAVQDLNIKQEEQKIKNDELNNTYVQMGFQIFGLAATTIPLAISAIGTLKGAQIAGAGATAVASGANVGFTASLVSTTAAVWANTVALLSNPIFAVAAAASIAAAVALIATNTWGLRDSIFGNTEAVKESTKAQFAYAESLEDVDEGIDNVTESLNTLEKTDGPMVAYWQKRRDEVTAYYAELAKATGELNRFSDTQKKSLGSLGGLVSQTASNLQEIPERVRALQLAIIAANNLGIGGGNALTLQSALNTRNVSGSGGLLQAMVESNVLHQFGLSSNFVKSMEGSRTTSTFGLNSSAFGKPSGSSFSQSGPSSHRVSTMNRAGGAGRNRSGGHSRFRQDRAGGKLNSILAFTIGPQLANASSLANQLFGEMNPSNILQFGRGNNKTQAHINAESQANTLRMRQFMDHFKNALRLDDVFEQLLSLNPRIAQNLSNFKNADALLASTRSDQQSYASKLGIGLSQIQGLYQTAGGFQDILNMERFREREIIASTAP